MLQIDKQPVLDARYLHPARRMEKREPSVSRLTQKLVEAVGIDHANKAMESNDLDKAALIDSLKAKYRQYQLDDVPKEFYIVSETSQAKRTSSLSCKKLAAHFNGGFGKT